MGLYIWTEKRSFSISGDNTLYKFIVSLAHQNKDNFSIKLNISQRNEIQQYLSDSINHSLTIRKNTIKKGRPLQKEIIFNEKSYSININNNCDRNIYFTFNMYKLFTSNKYSISNIYVYCTPKLDDDFDKVFNRIKNGGVNTYKKLVDELNIDECHIQEMLRVMVEDYDLLQVENDIYSVTEKGSRVTLLSL